MFWKIVSFEIRNRVRRPAFYLYFGAVLLFTIGTFATGGLRLNEKEHINAPYILALWFAGVTLLMTLISSSVMGDAIYRDIEYETRDYYLAYPITKAGYFWGRYCGSFMIMPCIGLALVIGAYAGTILGPALGLHGPSEYGANRLSYYLQPFFCIALPNLFFTSSLFFGLVSITQNIKVIYSGGILLFLGYFLSQFFLSYTHNEWVIGLADPFGLNVIRLLSGKVNSVIQNNSLISVSGILLTNRILWTGIGLLVLLYSYATFSFERFFQGRGNKTKASVIPTNSPAIKSEVKIRYDASYNRQALLTLTKTELGNIISDHYFRLILFCGVITLGVLFSMGIGTNGVPDLPRTVMLLNDYNGGFLFYIFLVLLFYTGEVLHRDRSTRFALINDALPMPNWVLNGSRLLTVMVLALVLSLLPILVGIPVQLFSHYHLLHIPVYLLYIFTLMLPKLLEMAAFCYFLHVTVNHKFAAHSLGVLIWLTIFFLSDAGSGMFSYNLLLYSSVPTYAVSDMDGLGHTAIAVHWFNIYWLLFAGLLILVSALFFYRGVTTSLKERWQLAMQRFDGQTRMFVYVLLLTFLTTGAYIYYNVSYLNDYTTSGEDSNRAILYEKGLKQYSTLPLPSITHAVLQTDLYPDRQAQETHGWVTLKNKTRQPIEKLLLDGDGLTNYTIRQKGHLMTYSSPLSYPRGRLNWFRPQKDTADFRLYQLPAVLQPGDSLVIEINSVTRQQGFSNTFYARNLLRNGTFTGSGLPALGYDEADEESSPRIRLQNHLPLKKGKVTQKEPGLLNLDITVSTASDQTAIAPGELIKQWSQNGRNYYRYTNHQLSGAVRVLSARYAVLQDTVMLDHPVTIKIYYHPEHKINIGRFMAAYKDGLRSFSKAYGSYPFANVSLAETSVVGPKETGLCTLDTYSEQFAWNANFNDPEQNDYCYLNTVRHLGAQWWRYGMATNQKAGSANMIEGLCNYGMLVMAAQKYGEKNIRPIILEQLTYYLLVRRHLESPEQPLLISEEPYVRGKAAVVLYGLRALMGADNLNAALSEFRSAYASKSDTVLAGSNDLFGYLHKHVPDSLQYYLTDSWQKVTLYDNRINQVQVKPTGKNSYQITVDLTIGKTWTDSQGHDHPVTDMKDYIDVGVFGADRAYSNGRKTPNPLYLKRYKLGYGRHTLRFTVRGKPRTVGVDPDNILIDRQPNDNFKILDN